MDSIEETTDNNVIVDSAKMPNNVSVVTAVIVDGASEYVSNSDAHTSTNEEMPDPGLGLGLGPVSHVPMIGPVQMEVYAKHPIDLPVHVADLWPEVALGAGGKVWFNTNDKKRKLDEFIPVAQVRTESYSYDSEDKYLIGIMLTVKVGEKPLQVYNSFGSGRAAPAVHKIYDRMCLFADAKHSGKCFGMVMPTKTDSTTFFSHGAAQGYGVGNGWLIKEPPYTVNRLGSSENSITLIEASTSHGVPLANAVRYVPCSPLSLPKLPDATSYFCYHNITTLRVSNAVMVQSGCNGNLCDRQVKPEKSQHWKCGCLYTDQKRHFFVIKMNVLVPCETGTNVLGSIIIPDFRSNRTTSVFIDDSTVQHWRESDKLTGKLRSKARGMIEYINENGGWTILGWVRTGAVSDSSDKKDRETIVTVNTAPHLSYMMPTHLQVLNNIGFKNEQFKIPITVSDTESDD